MTEKQALEFIERDGDLHLAPGKPAEQPPAYQRLIALGFIKKNVKISPRFWDITRAGHALLNPQLCASAVTMPG